MGVSLIVDAEEIAEEIRRAASESVTEEDLTQGVEYVLKRGRLRGSRRFHTS